MTSWLDFSKSTLAIYKWKCFWLEKLKCVTCDNPRCTETVSDTYRNLPSSETTNRNPSKAYETNIINKTVINHDFKNCYQFYPLTSATWLILNTIYKKLNKNGGAWLSRDLNTEDPGLNARFWLPNGFVLGDPRSKFTMLCK